jgi:hypothetical protein
MSRHRSSSKSPRGSRTSRTSSKSPRGSRSSRGSKRLSIRSSEFYTPDEEEHKTDGTIKSFVKIIQNIQYKTDKLHKTLRKNYIHPIFNFINDNSIDDDIFNLDVIITDADWEKAKKMLTNGIENNANVDINIFSNTIKKIINLKFGFNIIKEGLTGPIVRLNNELTNSISLPQRYVYDIPIYIIIEIGKNIHASVIILYKKKVYTFGYGFSFTDKNFYALHRGDGAIYTQDYLFQPQVAEFKYRVIDIGELNQHHISKINSILHDVRFINSKFIDINPTTVYNSTNILSGEKIPRYSTISNKLTKTLNCTSFVRYIFGDRVTCGVFIEEPYYCKRKKMPYYINESHINTLSALYLKGNYNNLKGFLRNLE